MGNRILSFRLVIQPIAIGLRLEEAICSPHFLVAAVVVFLHFRDEVRRSC